MRTRPADLGPATLVPVTVTVVGLAVVVAIGLALGGLGDRPVRDVRGIPRCPAAAEADLLGTPALECWFEASRGLWRTTYRVFVHSVLLVHVEAASLLDAEEIARRFVDQQGGTFREVDVYVVGGPGDRSGVTRRVIWTPAAGYAILDF
jgi:hypothetical protein